MERHLTDSDLSLEDKGPCPEGFWMPSAWTQYQAMLSLAAGRGLVGCPMGTSTTSMRVAIGNLLVRASAENEDVTFYYDGSHGRFSYRNAARF